MGLLTRSGREPLRLCWSDLGRAGNSTFRGAVIMQIYDFSWL